MYELMCWSWSTKPHHRPSFTIIRQLALSQAFTRLHYAMKVEPQKHAVTAIAVRYYKPAPSTTANDVTASYSYPYRNTPPDVAKRPKLSLQISAGQYKL